MYPGQSGAPPWALLFRSFRANTRSHVTHYPGRRCALPWARLWCPCRANAIAYGPTLSGAALSCCEPLREIHEAALLGTRHAPSVPAATMAPLLLGAMAMLGLPSLPVRLEHVHDFVCQVPSRQRPGETPVPPPPTSCGNGLSFSAPGWSNCSAKERSGLL
jgi:hypothetical protein